MAVGDGGLPRLSGVHRALIGVVVSGTVIIAGWKYVNPSYWHPFIPENQGPEKYGWSGIIRGAALVFFAYIGFEATSTAAQEAKNPQRDLPIGILGSLFICTILYILVSGLLTGVVTFKALNVPDPVAVGVDAAGIGVAFHVGGHAIKLSSFLVKLGAIAGLGSVMLVMLLGQTRVLYSMAKDGLLPSGFFAAIHPKFRTPWKNTMLVGLVAAIVGSLTPIDDIGKMVNIGTLLAFVIVCIAVLVLRPQEKRATTPFPAMSETTIPSAPKPEPAPAEEKAKAADKAARQTKELAKVPALEDKAKERAKSTATKLQQPATEVRTQILNDSRAASNLANTANVANAQQQRRAGGPYVSGNQAQVASPQQNQKLLVPLASWARQYENSPIPVTSRTLFITNDSFRYEFSPLPRRRRSKAG